MVDLINAAMKDEMRRDGRIVVFGEEPYAEFVGDRKDLAFRDEEGLTLLKAYRARGIPTVAVFLSGRPLWVNRELNAADAFVAAWLPGSEGAGVADVDDFAGPGMTDQKPRHGIDRLLRGGQADAGQWFGTQRLQALCSD